MTTVHILIAILGLVLFTWAATKDIERASKRELIRARARDQANLERLRREYRGWSE